MNKLLIVSLLFFCCTTLSATVKPRDGFTDPFPNQHEEQDGPLRAPWKIGSQKTAPLKATGSPKVPVILAQFTDKKFMSGLDDGQCDTEEEVLVVNEFYHKFCNGLGDGGYYKDAGSYGAITEYFRDQSDGMFTPEFVIIGPVTLDNTYAYYGKDGSKKDTNLSQFYEDAIKKAQEVYFNWNDFDNDNNGSIDMAFFVYAGDGQNGSSDTNTIWPQETQRGGTINGKTYGCYACCNEIYKGKTDGIGVFCHEMSHALGLPDFYDTNYVAYGMDYWDLMDSGCYCNSSYCPCNYTAYERWFMGWTELETLNPNNPCMLTLYSTSSFYMHDHEWKAYKIVNLENSNEYYILENRQSVGWDQYVGRSDEYSKMKGMLIVHVDYVASRWNNNTVNTNEHHQYMTIMPADGILDSYMYVDNSEDYKKFLYSAYGDLYPGYKNITSFEGPDQFVYTTTGDFPNEMNQPLYNIRQNDDGTVTLSYMKRYKYDQHVSISELPEMTYGDANYLLPESTDAKLKITWTSSNNKVATINGDSLHIVGAGTATITASQAGNASNNPMTEEFQLTVNKANLTVSADNKTKTAGEANPEFTITCEGFLFYDDEDVLTAMPNISCEADENSPAGEYAIVLEGGSAPNYELTLVNGTLTILNPTYTKGDVNEDGSVDISDIVAIINQIAGSATYRYADVNEDGYVDISDIVGVINIIAGKQS